MPNLPEQQAQMQTEQLEEKRVLSISQLFLRATLLSLVFVAIFFLLTAIIIGIIIFLKVNNFRQNAELSWADLNNYRREFQYGELQLDNSRKNMLVLGLDAVSNRKSHPLLTDTILLSSIDPANSKIFLLSIPRDLWSEEYQTKINALYVYGEDRYPEEPERFPTEVIASQIDQEIHHTITLSLDTVAQMIDILGGVEVEIKESFIDKEFPRDNVDINNSDPSVLYETVEFAAGKETMDSVRALKYIRSRHAQGDIGTDNSRGERQQAVIEAILAKASNLNIISNPKTMAELYLLYEQNFAKSLPSRELLPLIREIVKKRAIPDIIKISLPIFPDQEDGVIEHPPQNEYDGQWVYRIVDEESFKTKIAELLKISK